LGVTQVGIAAVNIFVADITLLAVDTAAHGEEIGPAEGSVGGSLHLSLRKTNEIRYKSNSPNQVAPTL
jgi:hypothetical protein